MSETSKPSRRHQILEALAHELEHNPGQRITTAALARAVGVSEAALYRHFPSKARMFEGLIEFIEESVFTLINRIMSEEGSALVRCEKIMQVLLGFSARNPGLSRILLGDALTGETERLRIRIGQFFDRVESQFKQVLREGQAGGEIAPGEAATLANLLLAVVEGRIHQYIRSGFKREPTAQWVEQWRVVRGTLAG